MEGLIFPILLVGIALMLFFQIRKQKRSVQEQQKLQNSIGEGDRVMTTSGLFGTVTATTDDSIELEIAPGVVTTWLRQAIREKVNTEPDSDETADEDSVTDEDSASETSETSDDEVKAAEASEKQKTS
ncbi:preprotein translocase subunit YajC [Saccharopolyspora lacisalsi]|uniref:Preprotein translocase subunit YajC n=1 Tax=Halosaccharopolyspora lacisalsi TaxID=1000566 RepID=A0A839DWC5_9PSEU|nr:preprotein translocase subunit YajC [Halosaccharopolyspora lacisalsi]MBA8823491.1 preprotein translocase subunit YajC [Halosaccharopolyspora lacisalsi]